MHRLNLKIFALLSLMMMFSFFCFTGVAFAGYQVSGAGVADANGLYCETDETRDDRPVYLKSGTTWEIWYEYTNWWIDDEHGTHSSTTYWHRSASTPPLTGWGANPGFDPAPTLSEVACAPAPVQQTQQVPTMSVWALVLMGLLLILLVRRRLVI
jgi:hypothetical protein